MGTYSIVEILGLDFKVFLKKTIIKTADIKIFVYHVFIFYLILIGTKVVIILLEYSTLRKTDTDELEKGKSHSIYLIIKYFVYVIALILFIESLGFNVTIFIASLSALLVGLGLGIQDIFNDFVSGFIILFERIIKVGDIVELENGLIGRVTKIRLRSIIIITRNDVEIIVPNRTFISKNIINWTLNSQDTRHYIDVGVSYGSDVRLVERLLIQSALSCDEVSNEPYPIVQFIDFGDSSLEFRLFFFSQNNFRIEKTKNDIRFEIDKLFRENNIIIPFPQRVVHLVK